MSNGLPTTRDRVLDSCRRLYNDRGPAAVTTAEIAASVGINEGNLYYYFKKKEQIVLALFDQLEQALAELGARQLHDEDNADADADNIMSFFKLAWEWRFFYRDAPTLYEIAPALRARNKAAAAHSHEGTRRLLQRMAQHGRLIASDEVIERLVVNTWIVATFWIEYLQVSQGVTRVTRKHLEAGYEQVQALYWPYVPSGTRPRRPRWD